MINAHCGLGGGSAQESITPPPDLHDTVALPCGASLKNRLGKSSLSEQISDRENRPTADLLRIYERWAKGGAGLLMTGNVMIDRTALEEPRNVVVDDERDMAMLKRWAAAAQSTGAHCWPQLSHPGRQSLRTLTPVPVAPSAVPMTFGRGLYATPRALEEREILEIIQKFARTARIMKDAGFSGVQLMGAHGYLISSFLSALTNKREDDWGGSPDKRSHFMVETLRAVRAVVGKDFPISIKLNSADFQRGGIEEEESLAVLKTLEAEGIDLVEISGGSYENAVMMGQDVKVRESTKAREAYFLVFAEKARQVTKVPLMLTGGFRSLAGMKAAIAGGAIDVVGLGRPLCVDPDLAQKLLDGTAQPMVLPPRRVGVPEFDAILEVFWYTQQLHRIAAGIEPDPNRGNWWALLVALWNNGFDTFRRKRS